MLLDEVTKPAPAGARSGGAAGTALALATCLMAPVPFAVACGPEPVTVDLVFPNSKFLTLVDRAEVLAFAAPGESSCAELSTKARAGGLDVDPEVQSGIQPLCDLDGGGVTVDIPAGDYDVLGVGRGSNDVVLVVGCTRAHVDRAGGRVRVVMANLSSEGQRRVADAPPCASVEARCRGACD
jgi:hypothetical protein